MAFNSCLDNSHKIMTKLRLITLSLIVFLTGCGYETLYSNLDEQQANEMLALLLTQGIQAKKTGLDQQWTLQIQRSNLPKAIDLLKSEGYPRKQFESLGDVFKKEGFVSSPVEERARLLHALSQELSNTLSTIDGVVTARVHLAIPERRVLSDETTPSSASVFIKYRSGSEVANQAASIKALVVNSIEGLPYDNVTVTFFASTPKLTSVTPKSTDQVNLAGLPQNAVLTIGGTSIILMLVIAIRKRMRVKTQVILKR